VFLRKTLWLKSMTEPVLQMNSISKRFPGVIALDAVNIEVHAGEVVALAGENGAGKSTLMKILGGVYQPDEGEIFVEGGKVLIRNVTDASNFGIGFVHQELNVLDNLTVAENVYLGREPKTFGFLIDRNKINADAAIYLKRIGLDVLPKTPLDKLSIAQQQLVEIAKALSLNAKILILDEPTSSLTLTETDKLLSVIKDLSKQGVSIIYISHRLGEIKEIADRVVTLRDGKNAGILQKDEIDHDAIVKQMVGRDIVRGSNPPRNLEPITMFSVENLRTSRYPESPVAFKINKGEVVGFAGLVGAGRSETAQAIFGVDRSTGEISIDGTRTKIASSKDAIRHGIFLVPEDRRNSGLILDFAIRENITLASLPKYAKSGLISKDAESKTSTEMCKKLNVKTPSIETNVGNLSGGNQQKVVLAKWLSLNPKLMIFDEPTRGIDVGAKAEIYQLMRDLAEKGVAIMMISSDMEEILSESDRIVVMHEGKITGVLNRDEASEEAVMKLAVGG
jgi:ribose transport system ATP-binding protein